MKTTRNPTVGVAVVLFEERRLLLARRTGFHAGSWCIPCGHVEWGEEVRQAAGHLEDWLKTCVAKKPRTIEPQRRQGRKENLFHNERSVFRKRSTPVLL